MEDARQPPKGRPPSPPDPGVGPEALPSFLQIQRWNATPPPDAPALKFTILRNIVLDPVVPYLRYLAWLDGFNATCQFGEYDNVVQESIGAPVLLNASTDCVLVFFRLETAAPRLAFDYAGLKPDEAEAETARLVETVRQIISGIRRQTSALLLWHGFELPTHPALGIADGRQRGGGQTAAVQAVNDQVSQALSEAGNAYLVDLNRCLARIGAKDFYDVRHWQVAKAPYTPNALREIAFEDMKYIRALKGRAKKCLVLDCDGVLWGGTIGEDGLAGIKLGTTFPGSAYLDLQREIVNAYHRGVLIALCSKNNEEDVWDVFSRHPDMVLRREQIAAAEINWNDKASNLRAIATQLNIGLDSLVMMDDSDFEVDLIRRFAPEVRVIGLPAGKASSYRDILAGCGLFDTLTISAEDRARGSAYQADAARRQLQQDRGDMTSFLGSLEMVLDIRQTDEMALPRVAQLTQKTNQFNLTTRRYSDEDIRRFQARDDADVIYLKYRDRFGDAGIVGVCIVIYEEASARLDSFMLSCRVLGRQVEQAFLVECLQHAAGRGVRQAIGEYRSTAKNGQVRDFYVSNGFSPAGEIDSTNRFQIDLAGLPDQRSPLFQVNTELAAHERR